MDVDDNLVKNPYGDILEKYPLLYRECLFIECGIGWHAIIDELSSKLEQLLVQIKDHDIYASQVKEKFGKLRFYMHTCTEPMLELINYYEEMSGTICDICGNSGQLYRHNKHWVSTRCNKHQPLLTEEENELF